MTDKELIELAANAAGIEIWFNDSGTPWVDGDKYIWNPLTDDGDALRLAVKLELMVNVSEYWVKVFDYRHETVTEKTNNDPYAATRRAITRAVAEIGRSTK